MLIYDIKGGLSDTTINPNQTGPTNLGLIAFHIRLIETGNKVVFYCPRQENKEVRIKFN